MAFSSILFPQETSARADERVREDASVYADLQLDQVFRSIAAGRDEYDLMPLFYTPLVHLDEITYRHEVMRDLERETVREGVATFSRQMRTMRQYLGYAGQLYYDAQKVRWFLDAAAVYCDAVRQLAGHLERVDLTSRGLRAFREYVTAYVRSSEFQALADDTMNVRQALSEVTYALHIKDNRVTVRAYQGEADYAAEILATFDKFRKHAAKDYEIRFSEMLDMNHVEAAILNHVSRLYPEVFQQLYGYRERHGHFLDKTLARFDREIQFYLAYGEYIEPLRAMGLRFCYPSLTEESKAVYAYETFDLALAAHLAGQHTPVVCNDFALQGPERIFVVTGPNQGGKTTFARMFGQLHYVAKLGLPVPGRSAQLYLSDRVFTHFAREEQPDQLHGQLEEELIRLREIFAQATSRSIVILNESFATTSWDDALFLGQTVIREIVQRDMLAVYVTFMEQLASWGEATVSLVAEVDPMQPDRRTYRIVRKPADGLAYALAIAAKYDLTPDMLKRRITA